GRLAPRSAHACLRLLARERRQRAGNHDRLTLEWPAGDYRDLLYLQMLLQALHERFILRSLKPGRYRLREYGANPIDAPQVLDLARRELLDGRPVLRKQTRVLLADMWYRDADKQPVERNPSLLLYRRYQIARLLILEALKLE